jgi:riboflavin biosynthesis pyrimidine reductase
MTELDPMALLFDQTRGVATPLPPAFRRIYGPLRFPKPGSIPHIVANFASTLDGVVALGTPGDSGGGEISGSNPHDRFVMGLLRAVADAVIVGAGTLRASPRHRWTAERVYPSFADEFAELRRRMKKPPFPTNVIVTGEGRVDLRLPLFEEGGAPVLLVTTKKGARRLSSAGAPHHVRVVSVSTNARVTAREVVGAITAKVASHLLLVEGGPHLIGDFFSESLLDELFLTLAPQVAGRKGNLPRLGLVEGTTFAPERPLWGDLLAARRVVSHMFLRFGFPGTSPPARRGR